MFFSGFFGFSLSVLFASAPDSSCEYYFYEKNKRANPLNFISDIGQLWQKSTFIILCASKVKITMLSYVVWVWELWQKPRISVRTADRQYLHSPVWGHVTRVSRGAADRLHEKYGACGYFQGARLKVTVQQNTIWSYLVVNFWPSGLGSCTVPDVLHLQKEKEDGRLYFS
jgi:hypothetical protein